MQKYGGNKGDRSKSHRDYAMNKRRDKHPMQDKMQRKRYDAMHNKAYGGDMGDESSSHRDYGHVASDDHHAGTLGHGHSKHYETLRKK